MSDEVKTKLSNAQRMLILFEGFRDAYGTYDAMIANEEKGGKLEIKASASTIRRLVNEELWNYHLNGERPLGIIPINRDNDCYWGVIDIDQYGVDHAALFDACEKNDLPLVICRSKSGGAHLFLFMREPIAAAVIQQKLKEIAALLGYGNSEIFPKQRIVDVARGDLGSWLNMPYFDAENTSRYGYKKGGMAMDLGEFLYYAEARRQGPEFMSKTMKGKPKTDPDWGDAPPCLQHLIGTGFPEGMRNKGLFALATFAKKKYGTNWIEHLERWNRDHFQPPLPASEVMEIIKGQEKKDYFYTCKDQPLVAHCNSSLCRTRKFGVGGEDDYPMISGLSVLDTNPPLWFLDVDDKRLELSTDELQNFKSFHKVCMERLTKCYKMMKQDAWITIVGEAMRNATRIDAPPEVGNDGQFFELLSEFLTDRYIAEQKDEILLGKPWLDQESDLYWFRLKDLQKHMDMSNFKLFSRGQMTTRLRHVGGEAGFFNLKGKGTNVWSVPNRFTATPTPETKEFEKEPI